MQTCFSAFRIPERTHCGFGTKHGTVNKGKSIIDCIGEPEQWLGNESSTQKSLSDRYWS